MRKELNLNTTLLLSIDRVNKIMMDWHTDTRRVTFKIKREVTLRPGLRHTNHTDMRTLLGKQEGTIKDKLEHRLQTEGKTMRNWTQKRTGIIRKNTIN